MNKVSEERMKLRVEYSRETDLIFSDNIPAYADWLEKKLALSQHDVSISLERAKKYARHQHYLGTQGHDLVDFEDWSAKD
jgi:hypothetical protein